ncbi:hypothetical protein D3C73_1517440 [compost metagenome]
MGTVTTMVIAILTDSGEICAITSVILRPRKLSALVVVLWMTFISSNCRVVSPSLEPL